MITLMMMIMAAIGAFGGYRIGRIQRGIDMHTKCGEDIVKLYRYLEKEDTPGEILASLRNIHREMTR